MLTVDIAKSRKNKGHQRKEQKLSFNVPSGTLKNTATKSDIGNKTDLKGSSDINSLKL